MPAKGSRKQFCVNGHDTFVVGRTKSNGCKKCLSDFNKQRKLDIKEGRLVVISKNQFCRNGHDTFICGRDKNGYCAECNRLAHHKNLRETNLKRSFGISLADYNKMFQEQNGLCLGCYRHQSQLEITLNVDHNHETGIVRGLLCQNCNLVLGQAQDNPEILRRLADYLENKSNLIRKQ